MSNTEKNNIMTDRVSYYFKSQWNILLIITISGLVYISDFLQVRGLKDE